MKVFGCKREVSYEDLKKSAKGGAYKLVDSVLYDNEKREKYLDDIKLIKKIVLELIQETPDDYYRVMWDETLAKINRALML